MPPCFLDTNVLIRFFVRDVEMHYQQACTWFREAERGERNIVITPVIVAETSYVLLSHYRHTRIKIAEALSGLLEQPWLHVEERNVLLALWSHYIAGLHFVDSYLIALHLVANGTVLSFDKQVRKRL